MSGAVSISPPDLKTGNSPLRIINTRHQWIVVSETKLITWDIKILHFSLAWKVKKKTFFIEKWLAKTKSFNRDWICDLTMPVWHSHQLTYEDTDGGSCSLWVQMFPRWMNQWTKWYMKLIIYWAVDVKSSEAMILTVMNTILAIA